MNKEDKRKQELDEFIAKNKSKVKYHTVQKKDGTKLVVTNVVRGSDGQNHIVA